MTWSRRSRLSALLAVLLGGCGFLAGGPGARGPSGPAGAVRGYVSPGEVEIRGDRLYATVWMTGGPGRGRREARLIGEDEPAERIELKPAGDGLYACRAFPT